MRRLALLLLWLCGSAAAQTSAPSSAESFGFVLLGGLLCVALYGVFWMVWNHYHKPTTGYPWLDNP